MIRGEVCVLNIMKWLQETDFDIWYESNISNNAQMLQIIDTNVNTGMVEFPASNILDMLTVIIHPTWSYLNIV